MSLHQRGRDGQAERGMGRAGTQRSALFGRERELAVLAGAIEDAATGRLQVVTIGGPAGIGKSRLAAEALARAAAPACEPRSPAAGPLDRDLSYAPVVQALRPLLDNSTARRTQLTDGLSDLGRL